MNPPTIPVRVVSGNHQGVTRNRTDRSATALVAGSAAARALHDLMSGQRVVRLDCPAAEAQVELAKVVRWLTLPDVNATIRVVVNDRVRAEQVAKSLRRDMSEFDDEVPVPVWGPASHSLAGWRGGVVSRTQIRVESGASNPELRSLASNLVVVGLDEEPWRGFGKIQRWPAWLDWHTPQTWPQRHPDSGLYARQVLVVGPAKTWLWRADVLLAREDSPDAPWAARKDEVPGRPWAEPPLEILLAGAPL